MASRVNTRFVIILIVGVIGLLGMLLLAYSVAFKSASDLSKRGDEFMAQGEYKLAELAYSKSVNKDSTNPETLEKWILALKERVPETETEYRDRFYGDYIGAIRKASTILRNDVDAHDRFLSLRHGMLKATGNRNVRSLADTIIEETNGALAFFREDPSGVQEWERLKRYRGLAIVRIARSDGLLEEEQYTQAQEDLERVLEVDPDDVEAAIGLFTISSMIKNRELVDDDYQGRLAVMSESLEATNAFLKTHPDNVEMMMYQLLIGVDIARREIVLDNEAVDRNEKIKAMLEVYLNDLNSIARPLLSSSSDQLNETTLGLFSRLENFISPESNLGVSREMTKILVESDPKNAELLWSAGRISNEAGESDEAFDWYARIGTLETKPLSFAGMRQYALQREALLSMATIRVDQAQSLVETADQATVDAATKIAAEIRDGYAAAVTDENLSLMMLDGKLARVNGELDEALRLFKKFNEQTQRLSTEGLWQEGITASQMGQFGVAKKALFELIPLDNTTRKLSAMLTLAQIQTKLKDYASAAQLYEEILVTNPNLEHAIDRLAEINMLLNPELNEDPVVSAVLTARQMKLGTETTPGDFAGAIEFLRTAIEEFDYDPILAREITAMLLDKGDIATARTIIAKSAQLHPDDDSLKTMLSVLASDDTVDIRIALQRESDRDELEILIAIAKIASDNDRSKILAETVAQLKVIAPDDKRVIEFSFLDAIKSSDLDKARAIAERSQNTQVESLAFKARIEITAGNKTKAIELLEQAAATGMADASIYRILANLQREAGLVEDSIKSFESALAIRPDNPQTCTEYLWTLAAVGRYEEGLAIARRLQRYGATNPTFMNIWLNLESVYGGSEGREFAIRQRERMLELDRTNADNMFQLARMYITTKQWDASRALINELRTQDNILPYVELDATWYADQGTYKNRDGLEVANQVFAKYIESLEAPVGAEPYVANAEFMLTRGRPDLAVIAANEAVKRQSPDTMLGSILLGDLYLRINNLTEAVKAYKAVIDSGADPDSRIRSQLVTTLASLGRFEEAQEIYTELPEEMRNSIVNMLQASDIARGLGDDAKSVSILNDAVSRYPNNPFVYITRAQSMIGDESLLNDLLSDISRAIDLQSNNWQAYRVRAAAYFAVDRKDEGLKDLRAAIRINPNHDKSIFAVLNELLNTPGREGEAMDVAREVVSRRPDDAILMSRIGGLFKSRFDWEKSAEMYGMAWKKRRAIGDGAEYIDSLVRQTPPDAKKANEVIKALSEMVGDINKSAGLLAAQALVLQARGREDFALQQMTKAFDLTVNDNSELLNWSGNLTRYFENQPLKNQVEYLEALKRRNTIPEIQSWLDLFIVRRMVSDAEIDQRHLGILEALKGDATYPEIQVRAFRIHGSTLFSQNKFEEAAAVWEEGLSLFSDDWEMSNNLAYVLASELDEPEKALSYGQTAIDQNIQRSEAYETMAGIYIRLGKYDEAEQMLDIGSNFVNSIQARVMMLITSGRLELARGNMVEAHSKLTDARSVLRSSPTAQPSLEKDIESFEEEINSADG
jgi:tetratricopeptide (TPR) repeat protein